jgi:hypothetical protein
MLIWPRRYATIRTRLDLETLREQFLELPAADPPGGPDCFMADGWFMNGRLEGDALAIDYHHHALKNPQAYAVRAVVTDTPDWRYLRLRIDARGPLFRWSMLLPLAGYVALQAWSGRVGIALGLGACGLVLSAHVIANLVYLPSVVRDRVATVIASELRGSVRHGTNWVLPKWC